METFKVEISENTGVDSISFNFEPIEDYKVILNRYRVYKDGAVYDELKCNFLKHHRTKNGYLIFNLNENGKHKSFYAHRLVAELFLENRDKKRTVNHIDGDKTNNELSNLEWNTHKENIVHAFNIGIRNSNHSMKRVLNIDTGEVYSSVKDLSIKTGLSKYSLYKSLSGERNNNKSFKYE
jgi:hypothetical protein